MFIHKGFLQTIGNKSSYLLNFTILCVLCFIPWHIKTSCVNDNWGRIAQNYSIHNHIQLPWLRRIGHIFLTFPPKYTLQVWRHCATHEGYELFTHRIQSIVTFSKSLPLSIIFLEILQTNCEIKHFPCYIWDLGVRNIWYGDGDGKCQV